jgi:signal transduction histidine kinase
MERTIMPTTHTHESTLANPYSIRWRLPLSYAGIALLAVLVLGGMLLLTLQDHYNTLERRYLNGSAHAIAPSAEMLYQDRSQLGDDVFQTSADIFSFVVQSRVRLLDTNRQLIADSGSASEQAVIGVDVRRPNDGEGGAPPPGGGFETFLSIQGNSAGAAAGGASGEIVVGGGPNPPDNADPDRPRYPIGMPRGAFERLLTGVISENEHTHLSVTIPLYDQSQTLLGYLELSESPAFGSQIVHDVAGKAAIAGLIAVLLAGVTGWFASRQISHPILTLADATRDMAEGDLSVRVTLPRRDELGLLARTFNTMAERVETTVTTLKQFVTDAAHEINTPITALRTNLELAADSANPDDFRADLNRAQVELERLEKLTRSLLTLSRLEARSVAPVREPLDLTALGRQINERFASRAEQAGIAFTVDVPPEPVTVAADEHQLTRVLDNLLDNALKFTPPGGSVTLKVDELPGLARLSVADTGIGIPAEDLPNLFRRFHRGRNAAAYPGNGLGLVITKAIVEEFDGQIAVESSSTGTRFTVILPGNSKDKRVS